MNALEKQRYFEREDAADIVASLAEAGIYANMQGAHQGWQVTLNGHTDLIKAAKVLDTFEVKGKAGVGRGVAGTPQPVGMLYRPYGGEGWPDVLIYWGSKP